MRTSVFYGFILGSPILQNHHFDSFVDRKESETIVRIVVITARKVKTVAIVVSVAIIMIVVRRNVIVKCFNPPTN